MQKDIEEKVDQLFADLPKASNPVIPRRRLLRVIGAGGSLGVIWKLLAVGVVVGSLIGLAFEFNIIQTTTIPTQGVYTPRMYFDDVIMDQATYNAPSDVFSDGTLDAGETEIFSHTLMSPADDGDWDVAWDVEEYMTWFHTPSDPSYGYVFNVTNEAGVNISYMTVMHGETKTIKFKHFLNSHFDQETAPEGGIPFKFALHVYPYVAPPLAVDDTVNIPMGGPYTIDIQVLTNDIDYSGNGLIIVSTTMGTINPGGQSIHFSGAPDQTFNFDYTIESIGAPLPKTDMGHVTVHCA